MSNSPKKNFLTQQRSSRVLLGIVGVCLVLWSIKAIHHAMEPKYQGKTAEEWYVDFDPYKHSAVKTTLSVSGDDPPLLAYKHFGPDAASFLWREYNHKDSKLLRWMIGKANYWSAGNWVIESERERNFKAYVLLLTMGPKADCLLPELNSRLSSTATPWDRRELLNLLNEIGPKDVSKLPFLIANLSSTNRSLLGNSLDGLQSLGVHAASALPALANLLQSSSGFDRQRVATVMIALGDQSKMSLLQAEIMDPKTSPQGLAFMLLASLADDGVDVIPVLTAIAKDPRSNAETQATATSLIDQISKRPAVGKGAHP